MTNTLNHFAICLNAARNIASVDLALAVIDEAAKHGHDAADLARAADALAKDDNS